MPTTTSHTGGTLDSTPATYPPPSRRKHDSAANSRRVVHMTDSAFDSSRRCADSATGQRRRRTRGWRCRRPRRHRGGRRSTSWPPGQSKRRVPSPRRTGRDQHQDLVEQPGSRHCAGDLGAQDVDVACRRPPPAPPPPPSSRSVTKVRCRRPGARRAGEWVSTNDRPVPLPAERALLVGARGSGRRRRTYAARPAATRPASRCPRRPGSAPGAGAATACRRPARP